MAKSKRLFRSSKSRIIGGVCGGLGECWGCNPMWPRLLFILIFFIGAIGLIIYIIMWIIVPLDNKAPRPRRRKARSSSGAKKPAAKPAAKK